MLPPSKVGFGDSDIPSPGDKIKGQSSTPVQNYKDGGHPKLDAEPSEAGDYGVGIKNSIPNFGRLSDSRPGESMDDKYMRNLNNEYGNPFKNSRKENIESFIE